MRVEHENAVTSYDNPVYTRYHPQNGSAGEAQGRRSSIGAPQSGRDEGKLEGQRRRIEKEKREEERERGEIGGETEQQ